MHAGLLFVVVVVVASQGGHFELIVLRHTASLFRQIFFRQYRYGALVNSIESLASSTLRFSWSRGLNRSIFVFFTKMFLSRFEKVDFLELLAQDDLARAIGTAY